MSNDIEKSEYTLNGITYKGMLDISNLKEPVKNKLKQLRIENNKKQLEIHDFIENNKEYVILAKEYYEELIKMSDIH